MVGAVVKTPWDFIRRRRTVNHALARAATEGLIFTREPGAEVLYRRDGDVCNDRELVATELLRPAAVANLSNKTMLATMS